MQFIVDLLFEIGLYSNTTLEIFSETPPTRNSPVHLLSELRLKFAKVVRDGLPELGMPIAKTLCIFG